MLLRTFYVVVSLLVLIAGIARPLYNWDIIPYLASAKAIAINDPTTVHSFAYAEIGKIPGTRMYSRSDPRVDSPFRALMRTDLIGFSVHLAFYKIRYVYNLLIHVLITAGVNAVLATHLISAIAASLSIWLLFLIGRDRFSPPLRYAIVPMALAFGVLEIARLSTPDALAFLVLMAVVYCFLQKRGLLYLLLPLLVAIRTDFILLVAPLCLLMLPQCGTKKIYPILSLILSLGVVIFLHVHYAYPGWKALFYFTFVDRMALTSPPEFGPELYARALLKGIWEAFSNPVFLFFACIAALGTVMAIQRYSGRIVRALSTSQSLILLTLAIVYVMLRMVVFPLPDTRFLAGPYIIAAIALLMMVSSTAIPDDDSCPYAPLHL